MSDTQNTELRPPHLHMAPATSSHGSRHLFTWLPHLFTWLPPHLHMAPATSSHGSRHIFVVVHACASQCVFSHSAKERLFSAIRQNKDSWTILRLSVAPHVHPAVLISCVDLVALLVVKQRGHILESHTVLGVSRARFDTCNTAAVEDVGNIDAAELASVLLLAVRDNQVLLARDVDVVSVAVRVPQSVVLKRRHLLACSCTCMVQQSPCQKGKYG
jgi:hypothetical protein